MFQHKGGGKQEAGESSERGLSCKSLSTCLSFELSTKISADWTEKWNRKSLSVKSGSSLKLKPKNVPPAVRELYLISLSSEDWM